MATVQTLYHQFDELKGKGILIWTTDTLKWMLVSSSYTFSQSHTQLSDVSTYEIAAAGGYVAGGFSAGTGTVSRVAGVTTYSLPDIAQLATGGDIGAFRRLVLYADKTSGGLTKPLLASILIDDTPADASVTTSGSYLRVTMNPSGIYRTTVP